MAWTNQRSPAAPGFEPGRAWPPAEFFGDGRIPLGARGARTSGKHQYSAGQLNWRPRMLVFLGSRWIAQRRFDARAASGPFPFAEKPSAGIKHCLGGRIFGKKENFQVGGYSVTSGEAATHGGKGDPAIALDQAHPESMLAAPSQWCPNPASTSCLRVHGRSMMPLIHSGYILVVDTSQTSRLKLQGQIVVAAHKDEGLIVSRLQRFEDTDVLVPENREYDSTTISSAGWRIMAKVLWWIGHPNPIEAVV